MKLVALFLSIMAGALVGYLIALYGGKAIQVTQVQLGTINQLLEAGNTSIRLGTLIVNPGPKWIVLYGTEPAMIDMRDNFCVVIYNETGWWTQVCGKGTYTVPAGNYGMYVSRYRYNSSLYASIVSPEILMAIIGLAIVAILMYQYYR